MVAHEPVLIRGPRFLNGGTAPLLLERADARFMSNVRDELGTPARLDALRETVVKSRSTLKLFQPVHRTFYVALVELVCDRPGKPRLDPAKVESAGLVVRRVQRAVRGKLTNVNEGWMEAPDGSARWIPFSDSPVDPSDLHPDIDPDAKRRRTPSAGHAELDRRLALMRPKTTALSEARSDLFTLPPGVAEVSRSTLLFGLMPTASLAVSKAPPTPELDDDDILNASYPLFLQAGAASLNASLPRRGRDIVRPDRERPETLPSSDRIFEDYVSFLQQMVVQYDLLGTTPAAKQLRDALNEIELPFPNADSVPSKRMADHLQEAAQVLVLGPDSGRNSFSMPGGWVRPNADQARRILLAVKDSVRHRLDAFAREEGQFSGLGDRFRARAFVRVRRSDGCPPELFWTAETASFEIAPWYESGPAPMPVVPLPDPFGPNGLSGFKPNVGFAVPASIADVLRSNSPDDLIKGAGKRGASLGIGWLCGFNIPLITLCAFIVLSIFLSLLQIVFWWLAFIKICIPLPKRQP